jgi:hypothetical protein
MEQPIGSFAGDHILHTNGAVDHAPAATQSTQKTPADNYEKAKRLAIEAERAGIDLLEFIEANAPELSPAAEQCAEWDRERNERDRLARRGYDNDCTAPSHKECLQRTRKDCRCLHGQMGSDRSF